MPTPTPIHPRTGRLFALSATLCFFIVGLGWFFWIRGQAILRVELREGLRSTAALAALQIAPEDIATIDGPEDMGKKQFKRLVGQLQGIRGAATHIRYAYIMRRTEDPSALEFVADADALGTPKELDLNGNGVVDPQEEGSHPGERYDITEVPALQGEAFSRPTVDPEFTEDQWGVLISGYAPIHDANGNPVAVLGIDMSADDFLARSQRIFSPVALILVVLAAIVTASVVQWDGVRRRLASNSLIEQERSGLLQLALHRLGTPLTIFKWSLEILADCAGGKACPVEDVHQHIQQMRVGIRSMDDIIKQLLEVERVEGGELQNEPKPTTVSSMLSAIAGGMQADLLERKQRLEIHPSCDGTVTVDPGILRGVLQELIHNASVFSPEESTITVEMRCPRGHIEISVADDGCGIPAAERYRIFQKFGRASNAHLKHPNGSGLGLYIARSVIEHAGGKIWMESEEGKGTTVTFTLPTA